MIYGRPRNDPRTRFERADQVCAVFGDHDPIVIYVACRVHCVTLGYDQGDMALCIVVKLNDVERTLSNPPVGYRLVAVCQHQGTDPQEVAEAEKKRAEEYAKAERERAPNSIFIHTSLIFNVAHRIYEWRELYYELIDTSSLLPGCVTTTLET